MGAFSSIVIFATAYWLTWRADQVAEAGQLGLAKATIESAADHVSAVVEDYAYWDLAFEVITAEDDDQVLEHIGSGAVESDIFDQLIILSPDLELLYEFQSEVGNYSGLDKIKAQIQPHLSRLEIVPARDYVSVSGFINQNGNFASVTASWVTPDYFDQVDSSTIPILIGINYLDPAWFAGLSQRSLENAHASEIEAEGDVMSIPLLGPTDQTVGYLVWDKPFIGKILRLEIGPPIVFVCIALMLACVIAAGFFNAQQNSIERLNEENTTDQMTGLLNRSGLQNIANLRETASDIRDGRLALIYLDLDGFKKLNDDLGHEAGDKALIYLARILQKSVREIDAVARVGGDEFVCIIRDVTPLVAANKVKQAIQSAISRPLRLTNELHSLQLSIGIAVAHAGTHWAALLRQADLAMYEEKYSKSGEPFQPIKLRKAI